MVNQICIVILLSHPISILFKRVNRANRFLFLLFLSFLSPLIIETLLILEHALHFFHEYHSFSPSLVEISYDLRMEFFTIFYTKIVFLKKGEGIIVIIDD